MKEIDQKKRWSDVSCQNGKLSLTSTTNVYLASTLFSTFNPPAPFK